MFQKVWDHFVVNKGKASVTKEEPNVFKCAYRGPNGTKCSIGVLIPDDMYVEGVEKVDALKALNYSGVIPNRISMEFAEFITHLQQAHDTPAHLFDVDDGKVFSRIIRTNLESMAKYFSIDYNQGESSEEEDDSNNNGLLAQT